MYAKIRSLGLRGIGGYEVQLELYLSSGLPRFDIVGLPDAAVKEARERVRAAIKNNGYRFPVSRMTVNLAPADKKKAGTLYDLPMFIGILAAVAIPNLVGMTDEAKVAKIQSDLSTIGTAMEVYHVKKGGTYPTDLSTLAGDNGYLKKVPEPPTGAGAYTVGSKGEVTCTFNGVTYSSFGT